MAPTPHRVAPLQKSSWSCLVGVFGWNGTLSSRVVLCHCVLPTLLLPSITYAHVTVRLFALKLNLAYMVRSWKNENVER